MSNLRNPFAEFAVEYGRLVAVLWKEMNRHANAHDCGFGKPGDCLIYLTVRAAWLDALYMQEALDWLAFDKAPEMSQSREWFEAMRAAAR